MDWRPNAIGFYGFDIIPDDYGKLWLLECNKCPSMEYSTAITSKLVPQFLDDFVSLIIDKQVVNFKLLHESASVNCKCNE